MLLSGGAGERSNWTFTYTLIEARGSLVLRIMWVSEAPTRQICEPDIGSSILDSGIELASASPSQSGLRASCHPVLFGELKRNRNTQGPQVGGGKGHKKIKILHGFCPSHCGRSKALCPPPWAGALPEGSWRAWHSCLYTIIAKPFRGCGTPTIGRLICNLYRRVFRSNLLLIKK